MFDLVTTEVPVIVTVVVQVPAASEHLNSCRLFLALLFLGPRIMAEHEQHGSLEMLKPLPEEYASPEGVELLYHLLEQLHPSEFQVFGSRSAKHWRNVCRIAYINLDIPGGQKLGQKLQKDRALHLTRMALGPFCPPEKTIKDDTFRAIGITLSLATGFLITPQRAYTCFHRPGHQRFQLSEYGEILLRSCGVVWSWLPTDQKPMMHDEMHSLEAVVVDSAESSLNSFQNLSLVSDESVSSDECLPLTPEEKEFADSCLPDHLGAWSAFFAETEETTDDWSPGQLPNLGQVHFPIY